MTHLSKPFIFAVQNTDIMAIKRTNLPETTNKTVTPPPPIPILPGVLQKLTTPPTTGKDVEYVYVVKGKELRRFSRGTWDRLPADKLGYSELSPVPPEALAALEDATS